MTEHLSMLEPAPGLRDSDRPAGLAVNVYFHRLRAGVAAMAAAMGGLLVVHAREDLEIAADTRSALRLSVGALDGASV